MEGSTEMTDPKELVASLASGLAAAVEPLTRVLLSLETTLVTLPVLLPPELSSKAFLVIGVSLDFVSPLLSPLLSVGRLLDDSVLLSLFLSVRSFSFPLVFALARRSRSSSRFILSRSLGLVRPLSSKRPCDWSILVVVVVVYDFCTRRGANKIVLDFFLAPSVESLDEVCPFGSDGLRDDNEVLWGKGTGFTR